MNSLDKQMLKIMPISFVVSIISFAATIYFVSSFFDLDWLFVFKILVVYYLFNILVSVLSGWVMFYLGGENTLVLIYEKYLENMYDGIIYQKDNIWDMDMFHRDIIEEMASHVRVTPEFKLEAAILWGEVSRFGVHERIRSSISWRTALRQYKLKHPERFINEGTRTYMTKLS